MSVLIKGMKMPKTCQECPMMYGGWCFVAPPEIDTRVAPTVDEAIRQGKPDWCPLHEVKEDCETCKWLCEQSGQEPCDDCTDGNSRWELK